MNVGRRIGDAAVGMPVIGPVARRLQDGARSWRKGRGPGPSAPPSLAATLLQALPGQPTAVPTVAEWLERRWQALRPVDVFPVPRAGLRLSVVTDSVGQASLFGGVGTALVLAALAANRLGATLRLVTRHDPPDLAAVGRVLAANGIRLEPPLEGALAPLDGGRSLPVSDDDLFLSTSWWTTRGLLQSVRRDRLAYLLQEDERMFYPHGDDRIRCGLTLGEDGLLVLVNSQLLLEHLVAGPDAIPGLAGRAICFEPSFPAAGRDLAAPRPDGRRHLFVYARPHHLRNLFHTGIEALAGAIAAGVLDPAEWEIHLVGKDIPDLLFPRGVRPRRVEGLSWSDYHALVASMDAGFVLMDTPHPSYPPLDLAAHGAAVLTNTHGLKTDLSGYSRNIIVSSPDVPSLVRGLDRMVALARDRDTRAAHLRADAIGRDWATSLAPAVDGLVQLASGGRANRSPATLPLVRSA